MNCCTLQNIHHWKIHCLDLLSFENALKANIWGLITVFLTSSVKNYLKGTLLILFVVVKFYASHFCTGKIFLILVESWLPWFNQAHCRTKEFLPTDYQQIMLTAPFLTRSLRKANGDVEYSRLLLMRLGVLSIANYIHFAKILKPKQ
ncbi:unnamed protein product [Brugia timori]|uniref:Transmembrane protein n=1 Tax=Brugia timori TaxID=42155 RepID=A0A0R3R7U0_9BILA|nr:unnamed protein product [Brugia timori]